MVKASSIKAPENHVRLLRTQLGLTQKDLAGLAHISVESIRGLETRRRNLSSPLLVQILAGLTAEMNRKEQGAPSFCDVFPNHLVSSQESLVRSAAAGSSDVAESADAFFALDRGPFGVPPVMRIRGFSDTPAGACGMPVFNTPAFDFVLIGRTCSGAQIGKRL